MEGREPIYLAVGLPYGAIVTPTSAGPRCSLRRGGKFIRVPLSIFRLWRKSLDALSRDELREVAASNGDLGSFERDLQRLVEAQLLTPWTEESKNLSHFSRLRVIPCGMGGSNLPTTQRRSPCYGEPIRTPCSGSTWWPSLSTDTSTE